MYLRIEVQEGDSCVTLTLLFSDRVVFVSSSAFANSILCSENRTTVLCVRVHKKIYILAVIKRQNKIKKS